MLTFLEKIPGLNSPKTSYPSPFTSPAWLGEGTKLRSCSMHFSRNEILISLFFFFHAFLAYKFHQWLFKWGIVILSSGQLPLHLIYFPSLWPTADRSNRQELKEIKNIFFLFTLCVWQHFVSIQPHCFLSTIIWLLTICAAIIEAERRKHLKLRGIIL